MSDTTREQKAAIPEPAAQVTAAITAAIAARPILHDRLLAKASCSL